MKASAIPLLGALILSTIYPVTTQGQTNEPPQSSGVMRWLEGDYMFGDWGGRRKKMAERGVEVEAIYFGAVPSNLSGGIQTGSVYEGLFLLSLDVDTEKLVHWNGGHFHAGAVQVHGSRFSQGYVGDLNVVSLIDFPHQFRLWELWYEQAFFDGKLSVKFGDMAIDRDFIVPEYYNSLASINFLNQTFFYPTLAFNVFDINGLPAGNHALASTPYGTPGIRLKYQLRPDVYLQAAVYDGNPDQSYSGTKVKLSADEGALAYFEAGYRPTIHSDGKDLPGSYKVGGYYHTDDFLDINTYFSTGSVVNHSGNWGIYTLAEQMVYRERDNNDPAAQGLTVFGRAAMAPDDRNLSDYGLDGGLVYRGAIPSRDWDTLGVAYSYLNIAEGVRSGQRAAGFPVISDYEGVFEVSYKAQMTAWWTLQPSFQWVMHPGGSSANSDALVFIVQTTLRF
jgi:porin